MRPIDADKYAYPGDLINEPTLTLDDIVPHGRWVYKPYKGDDELLLPHCSECDTPNANTRKHCPECGAKMAPCIKVEKIEPWCEECVFFKPIDMDGEGECRVSDPPQETWYGSTACALFKPAERAKMDLEEV